MEFLNFHFFSSTVLLAADNLLLVRVGASATGFAMVVLAITALFGQPVTPQINPSRRLAIARGQDDRSTPFEWPLTAAIAWIIWNFTRRLAMPRAKEKFRRTLIAAGSPGFYTVDEYLAMSVLIALSTAAVLTLLDWGFFESTSIITFGIVFILSLAVALYWPFDQAKKRTRKISRQLPYTLELISLAMGAGATFTEAINTVSRENPNSAINVEFKAVLAEMDLGATRTKALQNLASRVPLETLANIVASIVQAEQLGTPIISVLNSQAELMRSRRSVRAEKLAALASVRILLPSIVIMLSVVLTVFAPIIIRAFYGGLM